MARIPNYEPLSAADEALLIDLADPIAPPPPDIHWTSDRLARLLDAAESHGLLAIVVRKLREAGAADWLPDEKSVARLRDLERRTTLAVGQSLLLQFHARRVMTDLAAAGIEASIVKGPVFASKLYPHAADRPFTDIDVLVDPGDIAAANEIIGRNGFELWQEPGSDPDQLQEYKWLLSDNRSVMIELHGNLIHNPGLRRKLAFGRKELLAVGETGADNPVALLMIAVIHAGGGHKFYRLQLLVDVLQAVRALPGRGGEAHFLRAARLLGADCELAVTLNLVGLLFGEERALHLAGLLPASLSIGLGKRLVTPRAVLDAPSTRALRSRLQRDAFRLLQKIATGRGG